MELKKRILRMVALVFILTVSFFIVITLLQSKLIFVPERLPADYAFALADHEEEHFFETVDGERLNAIWSRAPGDSRATVLYFHGNAGSLRTWKEVASDFTALGLDTFIIDYRGYGKSSGRLSEAGLYHDAQAAWDYLLAKGLLPADIVIYGRSIGTGVASELAANVDAARALILESPFTSLVALAKELNPFLLPGLLLRFRFDNATKLPRAQMPILLVHGARDGLIPASHSHKLHPPTTQRSPAFWRPSAERSSVTTYAMFSFCLGRGYNFHWWNFQRWKFHQWK
ncbi:MAG: alpha/beta hydrolase [Bradymonadaceae bacterium]|nr:alpha/beta hydrolase [Lujinxingiaceae bacterium]